MSQLTEENEFSSGGRESLDKRAGWWAWPSIVGSVIFIAWSVNWIPDEAGAVAESDSNLKEEVPGVSSDLAILQIQSQVLVASASFDPKSSEATLEELKKQVGGSRGQAALALLERFLDAEGDETQLSWGGEDGAADWLGLVEKARTTGLTEMERDDLREHLGWFADLAPDLDGNESPYAGEIRAKAVGVMVGLSAVFVCALAGIIAGGILLIWLVRAQRQSGKMLKFSPTLMPRGILLECFALYLGIMALSEIAALKIHPIFALVGYVGAVVAPLIWPRIRGVSRRSFLLSIGCHRGQGIIREVGAGAVGYLGVMAIASVGISLTWLLSLIVGLVAGGDMIGDVGYDGPVEAEAHPIVGWIYSGGLKERLLCLALAAGFAPLVEEFFFRGALHRHLRGRFGFLVSSILTGVIFASLHPQGWLAIPALASIGVGFSLLREWRDSLIAPMVAHAINNGALVGFLCIVL